MFSGKEPSLEARQSAREIYATRGGGDKEQRRCNRRFESGSVRYHRRREEGVSEEDRGQISRQIHESAKEITCGEKIARKKQTNTKQIPKLRQAGEINYWLELQEEGKPYSRY